MNILGDALAVITSPRQFYQRMEKTGGFGQPLVFLIVLGVLSGLVQGGESLVGLRPGGAVIAAAVVVATPIIVAIFGFVAAGIVFVIWKVMGSQEPYETAYRCLAYSSAVAPINGVLGLIPFAGPALGFVWSTVLIVIASEEVHKVRPAVARVVFGGLCAVLIAMSLVGQLVGRYLGGADGALRMQQMAAQMQAQTQAQAQALQQAQARLQGQLPPAPGQLSQIGQPAQPGQPPQGQLQPGQFPSSQQAPGVAPQQGQQPQPTAPPQAPPAQQ